MHDEYLAIGKKDGGSSEILASGNDLQQVRRTAEEHVNDDHEMSVAIYSRNAVVAIVCAPKWQ